MTYSEQEKLIYVVDDSEIIADMLRKLMDSMSGIAAIDFQTGEDMLKHLPKHQPSLIFLDYYLSDGKKPQMNGLQVLKAIKAMFNNIPVVLITGMISEDRIQELMQAGFNDVLHKDGDNLISEVIACVHRYVY